MRKPKGFTLIELLVVIAIIGILAAIVLVALGSARNKAKDARLAADASQVRTLAELIYSDNTSYWKDGTHGICVAGGGVASVLNGSDVSVGPQIDTLLADISSQQNTPAAPICYTNSTNYCVSIVKNTGIVCVGDAGKTGNVACASATTCN